MGKLNSTFNELCSINVRRRDGHYGGKAEVYMHVGEAMGKAMAELLKNK